MGDGLKRAKKAAEESRKRKREKRQEKKGRAAALARRAPTGELFPADPGQKKFRKDMDVAVDRGLAKIASEAIPPAPPQPIPAPTEPVMAREIVAPPPSFDQPLEVGSLAHAVAQPDRNIANVVTRHFSKPRQPYISEWTGASEAGDPCIRKLAYQRLTPERALPPDEDLSFIFKHGNWVEREALAELADAGYEVVEQQRPFVDRTLGVKGKVDGKLVIHDGSGGSRHKPPLEIKGYAPQSWSSLNTARDFIESEHAYLKKVPAQVTLYILMAQDPDAEKARVGFIYMKNKLTGRPKLVVVPFDQRYADWLLARLRLLKSYVDRKELPPRVEFDEALCGKCPFRHVCLGEMPPGVANPVVLDPEKQTMLLEMLAERERLDPMRKAFAELDEKIGNIVRGHEKVILENYIVTGRWVEQERVDSKSMPEAVKAPYLKKSTYWKKDILNVRAQRSEE